VNLPPGKPGGVLVRGDVRCFVLAARVRQPTPRRRSLFLFRGIDRLVHQLRDRSDLGDRPEMDFTLVSAELLQARGRAFLEREIGAVVPPTRYEGSQLECEIAETIAVLEHRLDAQRTVRGPRWLWKLRNSLHRILWRDVDELQSSALAGWRQVDQLRRVLQRQEAQVAELRRSLNLLAPRADQHPFGTVA